MRFSERLWIGYLLVGALLVGAHYAVPVWVGPIPARVIVYCAVSTSAAVAVWWGLIRYHARPAAPWVLLGLSQVVYAAADLAFYVSHYILGDFTYPALADVLYVGHYPLAVAGLFLLIRRRKFDRDVPGVLDALSLTVVAGLLSWVMIIGPQTRTDTAVLVKVTSLLYPVMDLALLLVAFRLIFAGGRRGTAFALLVGWLLAIFTADSIYVLQRLDGSYEAGNFLDAVWLFGNLALGACALHPGMRWLGVRSDTPPKTVTWPRLAAVSVGAFVAPVLLLVNHLRGGLTDIPAYAIACAVLIVLTVARLAVVAEEYRRLAITDDLTRLHTRRFFEATLELDIARAKREGSTVGVVIIDVDRFKAINDTYGHPAGDRVLVEVADRLRHTTRSGETLSRYGGEEFALITTGTGSDHIGALAERLTRAISASEIPIGQGEAVRVTVSVGAAVLSTALDTADDLVAAADRALYLAKSSGRDRAVVSEANDATRPDHLLAPTFLYELADLAERRLGKPGHGTALAKQAGMVARELKLAPTAIDRVQRAARLAHIGTVVLPERDGHAETAHHLISLVADHDQVAEIIGEHREPWSQALRIESRILAVCATWSPLPPAEHPDPVEHLRSLRGTLLDPHVVDVLIDLHERDRLPDPPRAHRSTDAAGR